MENIINNLISKLHDINDALLIDLLKQKLVKTYVYNPSFTDKEIHTTTHGLSRVLCNMVKQENELNINYTKRKLIIDKNSCTGYIDWDNISDDDNFLRSPCKNSLLKTHRSRLNTFTYYGENKKNDVCISCMKRKNNLQKYVTDIDEMNWQTIDKLMNKETVEVFAAINKIKNKLKQLKK